MLVTSMLQYQILVKVIVGVGEDRVYQRRSASKIRLQCNRYSLNQK
jgi:hypothetical protein